MRCLILLSEKEEKIKRPDNYISLKEYSGLKEIELINSNVKTGHSLNLLHGYRWEANPRFKRVLDLLEKKVNKHPSSKSAEVLFAVKKFLKKEKTIKGTCASSVIHNCFKQSKGDCYCNNSHGYVEAAPNKFVKAWIRALYFRDHPDSAWYSVARWIGENEKNLSQFEKDGQPLRLWGQGDCRPQDLRYIKRYLPNYKDKISGFTRRPNVWLSLQESGFHSIALSIDKTILSREKHISLIENKPKHWPIVFGPLDGKKVKEKEWKDIRKKLKKVNIRVIFEKHHGGRISKETLKLGVEKKNQCPTTHDKMNKAKHVRVCFEGCKKCHTLKKKLNN